MVCPKCESEAVSVIPAEVRLYRNSLRTMSHPPIAPSPDVRVCLDCGWSEFSVPRSWLSAGWLRSLRAEAVTSAAGISP
ncbi:MAG: hypothetical protein P4L26_05980 [Terracidiphilus sp.]|nr:hypothetical protein [Terracidiphilus sp.]